MNPISIITCAVGIIGCIVGVATFVSASLTRAKEDGKLMAKVDYLVNGFDELKQDAKTRNSAVDKLLDEHSTAIADLQARMNIVEKEISKI